MSASVKVCSVDPEALEKLRKFRFRKEKTNAAIVLKIITSSQTIVIDEEYDDCTVEELQDALPPHSPSYVVFSYVLKHNDGRVSYPLVFIYISPSGCKPELQMMYAGSKLELVKQIEATKVYELRSTEEFTEEWLTERLLRC